MLTKPKKQLRVNRQVLALIPELLRHHFQFSHMISIYSQSTCMEIVRFKLEHALMLATKMVNDAELFFLL